MPRVWLITTGTVLAPASADEGSTKTLPVAVTISANGSSQNQAAFRLDGANNDIHTNVDQPFPFPDAVPEFSVQTSNYSARYGGNTGGVVNIVTRSGENQIPWRPVRIRPKLGVQCPRLLCRSYGSAQTQSIWRHFRRASHDSRPISRQGPNVLLYRVPGDTPAQYGAGRKYGDLPDTCRTERRLFRRCSTPPIPTTPSAPWYRSRVPRTTSCR